MQKLTSKFVQKWKNKSKPSFSFLDKFRPEVSLVLKKVFLEEKKITQEEEKLLITFFLTQVAQYMAYEEKPLFVSESLYHLSRNPFTGKFLLGLIKADRFLLKSDSMALPKRGVFVCPSPRNKYQFIIPISPKEGFLIHLGGGQILSDKEIVEHSLSVPGDDVLLPEEKNLTVKQIESQQKKNRAEIGDLMEKLEDSSQFSGILIPVVQNLTILKNPILEKPLGFVKKFLG